MWCECCKADVATELSLDHRRFACTRCGTDLGHTAGISGRPTIPRVADSERDARELLARWSATSVLEPLSHTTVIDAAGPTLASTVRMPSVLPVAAMNVVDAAAMVAETPTLEDESETDRPPRRKRRRTEASDSVVPLPTIQTSAPAKFSWSQLAGHLAAYGGVGLLSVGMTLVIWSYFGGPSAYAPTGWLLTTVGQMLLYLGVVTLVASGLEETTETVTLQMQKMGDKLERLEAASRRQSRILRKAA